MVVWQLLPSQFPLGKRRVQIMMPVGAMTAIGVACVSIRGGLAFAVGAVRNPAVRPAAIMSPNPRRRYVPGMCLG